MASDDEAEIDHYVVELAMDLAPGATENDEDERYERIRHALVQYEDAVDPPLRVTLTRRAPDRLPMDDLLGVLSTCRDAVVDVLGVASDHPGVDWHYDQEDGAAALVVEVRRGGVG